MKYARRGWNGGGAGEPRKQNEQRIAVALMRAWAPAYRLASANRHAATAIVYGLLAVISYAFAFQLRFEFQLPPAQRQVLVQTLPVLVLLRLAFSYLFSISTGRWRYVGTGDVRRLVACAGISTTVLFAASWGIGILPTMPRSVLLIDLFLYTWLTAGMWIGYRTAFEQLRALPSARRLRKRVLIIGAGEAGSMLAHEILRSSIRRQAVGFIDDDPTKWRCKLHGLPVFGGISVLPSVVATHGVHEIVIAIPSATPAQLRHIVECCEATDLTFKVLPGLAEVLEGRVQWNQVRPLRIEDLLGREPIALELPELFGDLHRRSVLITGAAGSIGSELSRQVALHRPATLVLMDQSETGLFELQQEMQEQRPELNVHYVLADIADEIAVEEVFRRFAPARVFHAAAYKHVTVMQTNVRQAVRNNVYGTMVVASAAGRHRAEKFVFVSTDKAVTPTSVMGASKRLAEMLLQELQARFTSTAYAAVRFGNVLGSSGSVIPIFRRQIEEGRPLTVTHPDATRYFMTIPEAVQLILQASLLPEVRGQIAMLDMGEPVKVVDLARNLLRIAGLPHKNGNSVVFIGLRDGEKLHEQLLAPDERPLRTRIEKVRLVIPAEPHHGSVVRLLAKWEMAFREGRTNDVAEELRALFPSLETGQALRADLVRQVS